MQKDQTRIVPAPYLVGTSRPGEPDRRSALIQACSATYPLRSPRMVRQYTLPARHLTCHPESNAFMVPLVFAHRFPAPNGSSAKPVALKLRRTSSGETLRFNWLYSGIW